MDQLPENKKNISRKIVVSALIIVVLILAGAAILNARFKSQKNQKEAQKSKETVVIPPDPHPKQHVPTGKIVPGLPTDFLAGSTQITSSYTRAYGTAVVNTADFVLLKTEKQAYDFYIKYLSDHKYTISNSQTAQKAGEGTFSTISATSAKGDSVTVSITHDPNTEDAKVRVSVSYVSAPQK